MASKFTLLGFQLTLPLSSPVTVCAKRCRVRLAVHKDTRECVAVKMVRVGDESDGLTPDSLKKEVTSSHTPH